MNRAIAEEIVARLGFSEFRGNVNRLAALGPRDWQRTLRWLDLSGLTLLFWRRLQTEGSCRVLPPEVCARLDRNLRDNRDRIADMAGEFDSLNRCLEDSGIPYAVLKGFALVPDYCPDAGLRTAYDYDYLLPRDSLAHAERALAVAGYMRKRERVEHPVVYANANVPPRPPSRPDDLYSPHFPRTVELHTRLWDPFLNIPVTFPEGALDRRRVRTWQNVRFYSLSQEDELVFQVLHAFHHILHNWCRLGWLFDLAHFLESRSSDSTFWQGFCEHISQEDSLPNMVGVVFSLAVGLFGPTVPTTVNAEIVQPLRSSLALWVDRYGRKSALYNFSVDKSTLLLHREFVRGVAPWREIRRLRLFPLQRPHRAAQALAPGFAARSVAAWRQGIHVVRRVLHHLKAAILYGWQSYRWERIRSKGGQKLNSSGTQYEPSLARGTVQPHPLAGIKGGKLPILFLNQQSWRSGAERVLDEVIQAVETDFLPVVGFPDDGPFAAELRSRNVETLILALGRYRSGPKSTADMIKFPPRSVYCGLRLAQTIRRRRVGLVYINSPRWLLAGVIAARLTGTPSVYHLHMTMSRRADAFLAVHMARRVTKILACSQTAATALLKRDRSLGQIMQVIYNPVRRPASGASLTLRIGTPAANLRNLGGLIVGVVGRVTPQKGQHVALQAVGTLIARGLDIQLVFVGAPDAYSSEDSAYLRNLRSSAGALGLDNRLHWLGFQDDPNPFYTIFDVLVIPSTVSEGLPMVALEAMRWGVPVIGSAVGGIPEVVKEGVNGLLVPPNDVEALASALIRMLTDPVFCERLQMGARASIDDRFSSNDFGRTICQILLELTSQRLRP